jgi:hypothetical protein
MHFLISIGIILAIIGIVLIGILKSPLKTSDKLLIAILATFVVKFSLDEVPLITGNHFYSGVFASLFGMSTIVTCGWYIKYITDRQPSKVFLLIGINDIGKDIPDAVIAANDLKIVNEIHTKCPQTHIYVESVLPVNSTINNFPQHYDKEEHVLALNKLLQANAAAGNYTYVDIFHLFADADGRLKSEYTYEGLHLKPPAYDIWVAYLRKMGYL